MVLFLKRKHGREKFFSEKMSDSEINSRQRRERKLPQHFQSFILDYDMEPNAEKIPEQSVAEKEGSPKKGFTSTPIPRPVKDKSKLLIHDSVDTGAR